MWFLGLVVAGGVEGEFSEEFACGDVDDADVVIVDEDSDAFVCVGSADSDVVHAGVESEGDRACVVDAVVADSPVAVGAGRGGFGACGVGFGGRSPVEGSVGADRVVVVPGDVGFRSALDNDTGHDDAILRHPSTL